MKRIIIIAIFVASWLLLSCGNQTSKGIHGVITEVPIKTEVLGLNLCEESSSKAIEKAIKKATNSPVILNEQNMGKKTIIRAYPVSLVLIYGGLSWHYVDVTLNEDKKIIGIEIVRSYESLEGAKNRLNEASQVFTQKYGEGNWDEDGHSVLWTDSKNAIYLDAKKSSSINGNDRSFCTLTYVNNELVHIMEESNTPEV